jgi:general secretion pathway protein A
MYEQFFGLNERPFELLPNPRFLYLPPRQREALSTLRYALSGSGGLTLLLGEAGTGKTTLVRTVLSEVAGTDMQPVLVTNPTLRRDEFYQCLANGLRLDSEAGLSKTRFLTALREHLESQRLRGRQTALLIDEAQSLPDELLEEVRLLSNIETSATQMLTVVLSGQPELAERLNQVHLRQLKQRIGLRCELRPFDLTETACYIAGRVRIAGGSPAHIFTREAINAIWSASGGIPRIINVLANNALIGGFAAQVKPIRRAVVMDVVRDFDFDRPPSDAIDLAELAAEPLAPVSPPVPAPMPEPVDPLPAEPESRTLFAAFSRGGRSSAV